MNRVTYRKEIGKSIKSYRSVTRAINVLSRSLRRDISPEEIINQSIASGWQGIFEPKTPKGKSQPRPQHELCSENFATKDYGQTGNAFMGAGVNMTLMKRSPNWRKTCRIESSANCYRALALASVKNMVSLSSVTVTDWATSLPQDSSECPECMRDELIRLQAEKIKIDEDHVSAMSSFC